MKHYQKTINNKAIILPFNKIVVVKNGMRTINPTEEMIIADGWTEYVQPSVGKTNPESSRVSLIRAKHAKRNEIIAYDSSKEVNEFFLGEDSLWLDKSTRAGLKLRFEAESALGYTETTLWYNGQRFALELAHATQMLFALESYASKCYDNTQMHLANLQELTTIEEVEAYDYKSGYPEKLHIDL